MPYKDHFIATNKIRLHFIEYKTETSHTPLILLHGLTANAHTFDGLVMHGLPERFHLFIPDLRGRGLSEKPAYNYSLRHHAKDIIGLMDHLGLQEVTLAGHSFGGLLSVYLAVHYPGRIRKIIILDAAAEMNSRVALMLQPVFRRLEQTYPSFEAYIEYMKASPTLNFWEDVMTTYYRADMKNRPDGSVKAYPSLAHMIKVSIGVYSQPWRRFFKDVQQPALLINATDAYNLGEPLLPENKARESAAFLPDGVYRKVDGNHQTMLYGKGAGQLVEAITDFVLSEKSARACA